MQITVNGKVEHLAYRMSMSEFIRQKLLEPERIVIEYNRNIVKREDWDSIILKENDNLEILRFVGGG